MKNKFVLYLLLFAPLFLYGQKYTFVSGNVRDAFSSLPVSLTNITVMKSDSTIVYTCQSNEEEPTCRYGSRFSFRIKESGDYIIKFTCMGYDSLFMKRKIPVSSLRNGSFSLGNIKLRKSPLQLKESRVTATRIKMVVKRDTMVFDAAAFQLSEGSMLDQLIRQLPGVELGENGRIKVNGRFVSSLLVNGEDFFKGDPKIALENLPAYMVNKVKVYEKQSEESMALGLKDDIQEKPLVMDVNLKKKYSIGWIANAEGGYGTDQRFMGRLFGLRFTPQSRLALFGNVNNTGDTRQPGTSGNWTPLMSATSLLSSKIAGAELLVNDKRGNYKLNSNVRVERYDEDRRDETSGTRFLADGDVYTRNRSLARNKQTILSSTHEFSYKNMGNTRNIFRFSPSIVYRKYENYSHNYGADFTANPMERYRGAALDSLFSNRAGRQLLGLLINRTEQEALGEGHKLDIRGDMSGSVRTSRYMDDFFSFTASGGYQDESNRIFDHYRLQYGEKGNEGKNDFRNRYTNAPGRTYNYAMKGTYNVDMGDFRLSPHYGYSQRYVSSDRSLYRLDRYAGWGENGFPPIGTLPSTSDSLQRVIDLNNTYYSARKDYKHLPGLLLTYSKGFKMNKNADYNSYLFISADIPVRFETNELAYNRNKLDTIFNRHERVFEPTFFIELYDFRFRLFLKYNYSEAAPEMTYLLNIRDDSNPLSIWSGNPGLRNMRQHSIDFEYTNYSEKHFSGNLHYNLFQNIVSQAMSYDRKTGVRTYRPENVNGNWSLTGDMNISRPLGKSKRLQFSSSTAFEYYNNVDLASLPGALTSVRSSVRNLGLGETLKGDYRFKTYYLGAKAGFNWTYATGTRPDFSTISCIDFNYGLTGQMDLPWSMQFSTDLTMYSRRGYEDRNMNTNELVWNARLTKKFLHGNLVCMIDGFNILGNLSNVRRTLNAQGRTETFYNVIPRYVMLRCVYRLNIQPKKKQ